ncbi:MAG: hypothetical protein IJW73_01030 [Candidatus Gastranaerophilales bacterium]|nr:hypothetical protein [Candidatus Gastranaerophilales bacterium]
MLNNLFQMKFDFAHKYFSSLLELVFNNERKFPQAIIFEGADTKTQYLFALELARILNCIGDRSQNCDCINCKWIKTHSHPAVNNVSQIHFKPDGDESKTVISVKQAREVEKSLMLSSDYHRFFIFFSSTEKEYDAFELDDFQKLGYGCDIDYSIEPLNYQTFHTATPNALLKSIEEPPERTTFIFLTKSREDILPTIVSRCLVFKLSGLKDNLKYNDILSLISNYPNIDYKIAFDISQNIQNFMKENNQNIELILNKILEYLKDLLKQNVDNLAFVAKLNTDIKLVNEAIKHLRANISDKNVLDTLFLRIARGY